MKITTEQSAGKLTLKISGRLDAAAASVLQQALEFEGASALAIDLAGCDFVSSAGIRAILQACQKMKGAGGQFEVRNVQPRVREIFELTGLTDMVEIRSRRELRLEELELFSTGVCGECYRLDQDTVVKLYREGVEPKIAEQEKQLAKAAFIMGIPTAISYDVVSCGPRTGVVFELIDADVFSRVISDNPGNLDHYAALLAETANKLHTTTGDRKLLPDRKEKVRESFQEIAPVLTAEESNFLHRKLDDVPDSSTCVHFDLHSGNTMLGPDGELVVIDMGDLSIGSPFFDLGVIYMIYGVPEMGLSERAARVPRDLGLAFWQKFESQYFRRYGTEQDRALFHRDRYFYASLRGIYAMTFLPQMRQELEGILKDTLLPRMMSSGQ